MLSSWDNTWPEAIAETPHIPQGDYLVDLFVLFDPMKAKVLLTATSLAFVLICVLDVSGVMFGLSRTLAGLQDENEHVPGAPWAFIATAVGTSRPTFQKVDGKLSSCCATATHPTRKLTGSYLLKATIRITPHLFICEQESVRAMVLTGVKMVLG